MNCRKEPRHQRPSKVWDTGQKPGEMNARSACLDILVQDNKYFIAHALVGQWEYYELERRVLSRADEQKPNAILIEDVGFGTALISTLKHKGLSVIAVKPEGDKKTRLLREIAKFANAEVFLLKTAPGRADVETELFNFPGGQRNDLVDALSQALSYSTGRLICGPRRCWKIMKSFCSTWHAAGLDAASANPPWCLDVASCALGLERREGALHRRRRHGAHVQ